MGDSKKSLLGIIALVGIILFGAYYWRSTTKSPESITAIAEVSPTPVEDNYSDWTLFRNGYSFPLPPKWKNTSDRGGTAVLEPGEAIGSIQKISVTILSDKNSKGQRFTTQKEMDEWSAVSGEVQGTIQKLKNINIGGQSGVLLFDTTKGESNWTTIAWTRKDNINVYLNFTGNKTVTTEDNNAIDYIISRFSFTTPAATSDKE